MKFKFSTISISLLLAGLLVYGFISLNSNDPYTDYAPGVETSITTSNGIELDTVTPAGWPFPVVWNFYYGNIANINGGNVGACFYSGKYFFNRWNSTTCYFLVPTPPPNGGPGGTPTSQSYTGSIRDMTVSPAGSDRGYYIWGGKASSTFYKFGANAQILSTFSTSGGSFRAVAYDVARDAFWNANFGGAIFLHDTTGGPAITTYANPYTGKYGMAYDDKSNPPNKYLWVWDQTPGQTIHKLDITALPPSSPVNYTFLGGASAGGAEAYESPDGTEFWLVLCHQNFANVAYKLADMGPPPDPEYYNYNNGTSFNSFPFNTNNKMIQLLVGPGEFNQPTGSISGGITHLYFRMSTYALGPATYSGLNIRMGQSTITTLPTTLYAGQLDTVYNRASVTLTAAADTWLAFTLDTPFEYDSTKSLIIQVQNCGITGTFSGFSLRHTTTSGLYRRTYSLTAACPQGYGGRSTYVPNVGINVTPISGGIAPVSNIADKFSLSQNYPNPFNPTTTINFSIPKSGFVSLKVFDVLGREVASLVNGTKVAGNYTVDFDGSGLSSGVYFYRIEAGDFISMKKMMLTK